MSVGYRILIAVSLVAHFAFVGYVVVGGFLAWRWPWTFWPHAAAALWGLLTITVPVTCPLTWAEDWARQRAGEPPLTKGFMDRYINGVLYPARLETLVQVLIALTILVSWIGVYTRWRGNHG
jgi:hypothetical protein